ncbi:hypothetical protein AB0D86_43445 [Streptomyces sp. NPDC048324]|uniref:hypothetical protein n=1 Tax=Streptomyces sp. NPDC048324 TaxID=3157205 RepID=UPI003427D13F
MSTIGTVSTEQPTPAPSLSHGDLVFVYNGPGLVTRLEGWALSLIEMMFGDGPDATRRRMVAVYRNADGSLDISARVSRLAAVESAWHLVNPAGDIVNGGPRGRHGEKPSQTAEELEAERDSGKYKSHEGSVPVYGIPSTAQRSPSADTEWVREVRTEPDGYRPQHLDHLAEAYRAGRILPDPRQPAPMPGDLLVEHHNSLGASLKPLSRIRAGERVEATVTIAAVRRFAGHVRLLLESDDGETAHARASASRFTAAEQSQGRQFKVGDQVLVRGYVEQEPALRPGVRSIDVCSIRAAA